MTNGDKIRAMTDEKLSVVIKCPIEIGDAEIPYPIEIGNAEILCDLSVECDCLKCAPFWLKEVAK